MAMSIDEIRAYDWDDEIEVDDSFELLPEGDYTFTAVNVERGHYDGSEKTPPCRMATVTFKITGNDAETILTDRFYLCSARWAEAKISQLHKAVGMKEHGKKAKMRWSDIPGCTGRCKVVQKKNQNNDNMHNEISKYYDKQAAVKGAVDKGADVWS